ncbi:MAG: BON domain-containing protein [Gallionellaceae bacterium]|nr:BON domain-containing protein [Gallionellaceae bacterium]
MRLFHGVLLAAVLSTLQGCFPIVAAGLGAGALMGSDRRTAGAMVEDERIEGRATLQINAQYKETVHVNVISYNRVVLITGEVTSEADKAGVEKIVTAIPNTKVINNELQVGALSGLSARSNDSLITSNVKLRFINNKIFQPDHVKVITESNSVYLMGLVSHKEAEAAAEIASNSKGVQRVVTVFEYLD